MTDVEVQEHPPDEPATVAQVEFVEPFATPTCDIIIGERVVHLRTGRAVRIVAALNEETGQEEFFPVREVPTTVRPSDLPHRPLKNAAGFDLAEQGPDHPLACARTVVAVIPYVDTDEETRRRGGDPRAKIDRTQTGGWFGKPIKPKK